MPQHRKRQIVPILNPRDERKYTSEKRAQQYVDREAAEFVFTADGRRFLHFVDTTPRAARLLQLVKASSDPIVDTGLASLKAIKGLPVAGDVVKLLVGKRVPQAA